MSSRPGPRRWLLRGASGKRVALMEPGLLAAVLAATDAALGQTVVSSPLLPVRIRQSLNVESGLNDGIALPVVLTVLLSIFAHGISAYPLARRYGRLLAATRGEAAPEHLEVPEQPVRVRHAGSPGFVGATIPRAFR